LSKVYAAAAASILSNEFGQWVLHESPLVLKYHNPY